MTKTAGLLLLVAGLVACGTSSPDTTTTDEGDAQALTGQPARDWVKQPAIVEIDEADEVYALSDVHGAYVELGRLLSANGLATHVSIDPAKANDVRWAGGDAYLVVAGDLIDKGQESLASIDFLRALQASSNGHVIVTMGNHEAEFLADPLDEKFTGTAEDGHGIDVELRAKGIDPKTMARGADREGRGKWLLGLPFGCRIKKWFFAHGGDTNGDTIPELSARIVKGITKHGYDDDDVTGGGSVLESQNWYSSNKAQQYADALGVKHIAFGHDPGALDSRGKIITGKNDVLVKLDVNMGLAHESKADVPGRLLHVHTKGTDHAEVLDAAQTETPLF